MELREVIRRRQSIRAYAATPVEPDKLSLILEAANRAPSAGNVQPYEIYVVRRQDQRTALAHVSLDQMFIAQAPITLVFCVNPKPAEEKYGKRGVELYAVQDATIACAFAMLAATDLGLSTVWIGAFDPVAVRKLIGAPADYIPVAVLPIGHGAETPEMTTRRPLQELVHEV